MMNASNEISDEELKKTLLTTKENNVHKPIFPVVMKYCALFIPLLVMGFVLNDEGPRIVSHLRSPKDNTSLLKNIIPPTLLPGGGRDWSLNLEEGTISPKHDDKFVLGAHPNPPLVLTNKGESNQITFSTDDLKALKDGQSVSMTGIGLQYPNENLKVWGSWYYTDTCAAEKQSIELRYLDDNFLAMKDQEGHDLVLDVSFWKMTKGNTVNFVRVKGESTEWSWLKPKTWFQPKTFQYGGGRDWILNEDDGTIGLKNAPYLVLGHGPIHLMLTEKNSSSTIKFDNLDDLASGESTILTYGNKEKAIGKLKSEEQYAGPWRYIESVIVEPADATYLKYIENNYIGTAEESGDGQKALVLDVTFWKMISDNPVNLVGGWSWKESEDKNTKNNTT